MRLARMPGFLEDSSWLNSCSLSCVPKSAEKELRFLPYCCSQREPAGCLIRGSPGQRCAGLQACAKQAPFIYFM